MEKEVYKGSSIQPAVKIFVTVQESFGGTSKVESATPARSAPFHDGRHDVFEHAEERGHVLL